MFSSHVIRKDMPFRIENAKILLIMGSISYHRDDSKYVSLENLMALEDEYVKNTCAKILSFKPDLIFVEQSVCHPAQDILTEEGMAVVLNVKATVMARVAKMFDASVLSSINMVIAPPTLGTVPLFQVRVFETEEESTEQSGRPKKKKKSLIFLDSLLAGSVVSHGSSIILRGGTETELIKVKQILKEMILFVSHALRECDFLTQVLLLRTCDGKFYSSEISKSSKTKLMMFRSRES